MAEKKPMSPVVIILIVVGAILVLAVVGVGVMAALGVYGTRKYISNAKSIEGKMEVTRLAGSIVACSVKEQAEKGSVSLPDSAPPVPPTLSDVGGKKYMSSPAEWSAATYACGSFIIGTPQYFQYEWQRVSATEGKAFARADLDGDGKAEIVYEMPVTCTTTGCTPGTLVGPPGP
jgi:hypothetical protein